jgi:Arc/MetJ-type ribon-helix-helix transcriptional regulator
MKSGVQEKMLVITTHLPRPIVEMLDRLVKYGIYPNRAEAIRAILSLHVPETLRRYNLLGNDDDDPENPSSEWSFRRKNCTMISFKIPKAQSELVDFMAEKTGILSKSKIVRLALDYYFRNHFSKYYL